ncbi:MAG: APC family permease [Oscillospiraceae bacterium]|jgi:APA family basic amino acid/polyamine antiporter|nr:amino acid permease [Christensenellales bacterium]
METQLQKRYGLLTAICMVVGIVIGSGVFFKATRVLSSTGGSMGQSLLTVGIVGLIMIICSYVFATLATRYEKVNGIVDYAEVTIGRTYAYYVGWFLSIIYYPALTSCLAWVSAQYTCTLFGLPVAGSTHVAIGALYLVCGYVVNALSPRLAGKFQVSTTIIKLIPLALIAVVGTIAGLVNGLTVQAFSETTASMADPGGGIFGAIVAFAFAYEGWIIATSINAELKDSKKNLPIALIIGALIVVLVYLGYFLGLTGALSVPDIIAAGDDLPRHAFTSLFGNVAGTLVFVFIVISCLGTMNGLMLGCCRGMYSLAVRGLGPAPKVFAQVDAETNMPTNSSVLGLLMCGILFCYWQACFFETRVLGTASLPAFVSWEPDELPIITLYAAYIPIFLVMMKREKDLSAFKRIVMPLLGILSCVFMVFCAFYAYRMDAVYYLIFFAIIMAIGGLFNRPKSKA